jgi:hypothetical protein
VRVYVGGSSPGIFWGNIRQDKANLVYLKWLLMFIPNIKEMIIFAVKMDIC